MPKTLNKLGEFGLIEFIRRQTKSGKAVLKSIGDDTAVLWTSKRKALLVTTDMLVEGVHFNLSAGGRAIGRKALACSISDIAAMGGVPKWAVVSFGAPSHLPARDAKEIYQGIKMLAKKFGCAIVGGDTVKSRQVVVNIALLGEAQPKDIVLRSGAKKGDLIFVTGRLGNSLQSKKHYSFVPRIKESQWLVRHCKPHAMIDISDGLVADLGHILDESNAGAILHEERIPRNPRADITRALYDGEDFELLFTVSPRQAKQFKKSRFRFYQIGEIIPGKKIFLTGQRGIPQRISSKGFDHFKRKAS